MDGRRVLEDRDVIVAAGRIAQRRNRRRAVGQQPLFEGWIGPGSGHDSGAVAGADLVLIEVDDRVDGGRIDQAFLRQKRLQGLHAQGWL